MAQKSLPFPRMGKRIVGIIVFVAIVSALGYLLAAKLTYRLGFPLDDAWIHQTYARNLAYYGEWSFIHGKPSGGSTSPLWSALLAPGFFIGLSPLAWTYFLGTTILILLAIFSEYMVRNLVDGYSSKFPWVGVFIALEWHLVWAAVSGMETLLSGLIVSLVLGLLALGWRNYISLGLLIGISIWVRPDGVTLILPAILVVFLTGTSWKLRLNSMFRLFMGFSVIITLYFLFNLVVSGTPFPNTFYAKQAEYAVLQQSPILLRLMNILKLPLIGAGILLIPGFVILLVHAIRNKKWGILVGMAWFFGYIFLYAWRLPVTYQHGRYIIPAMPVFFTWGLAGMFMIVTISSPARWRWILVKTWQISTAIAVISFWFLGARAYAADVAFIESEMVETAHWVSGNIPSNALIAAHDIGALGYFAPRNLLDLAGLVSPDVIPFIRDENQLSAYIDQKNVNYLITFPDWYPMLVKNRPLVFKSNGQFAPKLGQENLAVYSWSIP